MKLTESTAFSLATAAAALALALLVMTRVLAQQSGATDAAVVAPAPDAATRTDPQECDAGESPDLIVAYMEQVIRWGKVGDITAYSIATDACNVGTCWLLWIANTNEHPVIAQNFFRLKAGRLEQIGMSWLKHGYNAASQTRCSTDCQPTDGTRLGVLCSDLYSAVSNGNQSNLGPRSQVNASTGEFPYPFSAPAAPATIGRRLQVRDADLDPALNAGALYFFEAHYVTPDDAQAGNGNNNASYRRVTVSASGGTFDLTFTGATQIEQAGIRAWADFDPAVQEREIDVPGDGRFLLAAKATSLGGGVWNYEYAVQNLNSHRSAMSFSVPIPPGAQVTSAGFHDVDYHSGEPYDGADWAVTIGAGAITWSTQSHAQNPNANALRWGTLYNFRFNANVAPATGPVTLGLFRPGTPAAVSVGMVSPYRGPTGDFDGDGDVDGSDYAMWVDCVAGPIAIPSPGGTTPSDCVNVFDFDFDGDVDLFDFAEFAVAYTG